MKIGFNMLKLEDMKTIDDMGFDYFETGICDIALMNDDEYEKTKAFIKSLKTPVEAFNILLPGSVRALGPDYSAEQCREYLDKALKRAKELGAKLVVFGSGGAKRIPEGYDREKAMTELREFVKILAEKAEKYDITVPIEALRKAECNCINNLDEAEELCDSAESENVVMLADWFHMVEEGDNGARMKKLGKKLRHVHIAQPHTREIPYIGDGIDYADFFKSLEEMGYDKRISFEGYGELDEEGYRKFLDFMRANLKG